MRHIPTLFLRNPDDRRFVLPQVTPGCEWVLAGEGVPTRQLDGVCVQFYPAINPPPAAHPALQDWWVRRKLKAGAVAPPRYLVEEIDEITGTRIGWEPAEQSSFAKFLIEAVDNIRDNRPRVGTHELLGPKVNRDPERVGKHILVAHRDADVLDDVPRDFDGLAVWLYAHPYEGIVWHNQDGRMAKLKRKDMQARG